MRSLLLALAALACLPAAGYAQAASTDSELERELARLTPLYEAARLEAERSEALRAGAQPVVDQEIVTVGPLTIVTTPDDAELARRLFEEEWARYAPIARGRTESLERFTFVFQRGNDRQLSVSGPARDVKGGPTETEMRMRGRVRGALGNAVKELLPGQPGGEFIGPYTLGVGPTLELVYRDLAAAPLAITQACFAGDMAACWRALGQMDPATPPMSVWLTPDEMEAVNRQVAALEGRRARCLAGEEEMCSLASLSQPLSAQPLPPSARASLIWFALERGGEGALDRFWRSWNPQGLPRQEIDGLEFERSYGGNRFTDYGEPGPPASVVLGNWTDARAQLSAAAQMEPDALMRAWLAEVRAARPEPPVPDRNERSSTALWIVLLAALAARSTRWRLA